RTCPDSAPGANSAAYLHDASRPRPPTTGGWKDLVPAAAGQGIGTPKPISDHGQTTHRNHDPARPGPVALAGDRRPGSADGEEAATLAHGGGHEKRGPPGAATPGGRGRRRPGG